MRKKGGTESGKGFIGGGGRGLSFGMTEGRNVVGGARTLHEHPSPSTDSIRFQTPQYHAMCRNVLVNTVHPGIFQYILPAMLLKFTPYPCVTPPQHEAA